ncbi:MAG: hypothetical protein ABIY70_18240 [Capsulimonas sp.]|uniref:hypothetical protein n=1 Tax=Capsulimonas sp. TaxID=2494211 RepID=UPI0032635EDD
MLVEIAGWTVLRDETDFQEFVAANSTSHREGVPTFPCMVNARFDACEETFYAYIYPSQLTEMFRHMWEAIVGGERLPGVPIIGVDLAALGGDYSASPMGRIGPDVRAGTEEEANAEG